MPFALMFHNRRKALRERVPAEAGRRGTTALMIFRDTNALFSLVLTIWIGKASASIGFCFFPAVL